MKFSTKDQDNDIWSQGSCARKYVSGWWHAMCHYSNLNGPYLNGSHSNFGEGIQWAKWHGFFYSLKSTKMMIRRK